MMAMPLANKSVAHVALARYRVPDFNNHFFVALKVAPRRTSTRPAPLAAAETGMMAKDVSPPSPTG